MGLATRMFTFPLVKFFSFDCQGWQVSRRCSVSRSACNPVDPKRFIWHDFALCTPIILRVLTPGFVDAEVCLDYVSPLREYRVVFKRSVTFSGLFAVKHLGCLNS